MADRVIEVAGTDNFERMGDVVFVHGLGGHPEKTWSSTEGFWLE